MSDLIIVAVSSITVFAAVAYVVMAWPIFLAIVIVALVWKAVISGRGLLRKSYSRKPKRLPNYL